MQRAQKLLDKVAPSLRRITSRDQPDAESPESAERDGYYDLLEKQ
jgi:hypothetical protein